jgi:hypothetical protein
MRSVRRTCLALSVVGAIAFAAVAAAAPALASSAFELTSAQQSSTNLDGSPASQAGSAPYETNTSFTVSSVASGGTVSATGVVKSFDVDLPPGLVGNPNAVPKCARAGFELRLSGEGNPVCPSDTQVGVALVALDGGSTVQLPVFNLLAPEDVAAQFGIASSKFVAFLDAGVHPNSQGEYVAYLDGEHIEGQGFVGLEISLWGDRAERPFLRLPTSCGTPQTLALSVSTWEDPLTVVSLPGLVETDREGSPVVMQGCSTLDFSPSLEVTPETSATDTPTGLEMNLRVPQSEDPNGLAEADLESGVVTLPPGVTLSSSAANGLEACSSEQIGVSGEGSSLQFNEAQPTCPAASKVGTVEVCIPILENAPDKEGVKHEGQQACEAEVGIAPLKGSIYVAQQETVEHALLGAYLVVEGHGILVKLQSKLELGEELNPNPALQGLAPGQIRATVRDGLQAPFNEVKVHFFGGPKATLMTQQTCGSSAATSVMSGWNGSVVSPSSNEVTLDSGCSQGFTPSFVAGTTSNLAGSYSPYTLNLSRNDSEQQFVGLSFTLPPGVAAKIAGVPRCSDAQANSGSCPESSQIGTVTVGAGPGPEPLYIGGTMYLTGPYEGAPFGEVVEVPAIAGPFDLDENGKPVTVRGAIRINSSTAQAEVVSDPLPTELKGIQIDERLISASVNRSDFIFNPTSCGSLASTGSIRSTSGTVARVSSPFQASGCASLKFKPAFVVSTAGRASKADGDGLDAKVTYPEAPQGSYANIKSVEVDLPKQLPARLTTLQKACLAATFEANPASCPATAVVGYAKAITPILTSPLAGPVYLVSYGNEAFPDVVMVLQGEGITLNIVGSTDVKKGITSNTFKTIPDAPISSFELTLHNGPYSVLATNLPEHAHYNLCGQTLAMPTIITAQNGAVLKQTTKVTATGCPKPTKASTRAQKLRKALRRCRKDRSKRTRSACETKARQRYGRHKSPRRRRRA